MAGREIKASQDDVDELNALFAAELEYPAQKKCRVCDQPSTERCKRCHMTKYCSRECQSQDWILHKFVCCIESRWSLNFAPPDCYEWFANCFQLRSDADFHCERNYPCGPRLVHAPPSAEQIIDDFLIFCLLARKRHVVPDDWDWQAFLAVASQEIGHSFSYRNARNRWVSERTTASDHMTTSRKLRATAIGVYGIDAQERYTNGPIQVEKALIECRDVALWMQVDKVGGAAAWSAFAAVVAQNVDCHCNKTSTNRSRSSEPC